MSIPVLGRRRDHRLGGFVVGLMTEWTMKKARFLAESGPEQVQLGTADLPGRLPSRILGVGLIKRWPQIHALALTRTLSPVPQGISAVKVYR